MRIFFHIIKIFFSGFLTGQPDLNSDWPANKNPS